LSTAHCPLLIVHCSLLIVHCSLPIVPTVFVRNCVLQTE
jgi:hypothetical protein